MPVADKDPIGALIRAANLSGETNNWSGFEEFMLQILVWALLSPTAQPTCPLTNQLPSLPLFYVTRDAVGLTWVNLKNGVTRAFLLDHGVQPSNFASPFNR